MLRPGPAKGALRRVWSLLLLLARDGSRRGLAREKLAAAWRAGGLLGVLQRIRLKLHWGSVRYPTWVRAFDQLRRSDRAAILSRIERIRRPLISVVVFATAKDFHGLSQSVESVLLQVYPEWELSLVTVERALQRPFEELVGRDPRIRFAAIAPESDWATSMNTAVARSLGEVVVFLDPGDELAPHALYMVAEELNMHPEAALVYSDEDRLDERRRRAEPLFKPDWNSDLLAAGPYVSRLAAYRIELVRRTGGFRQAMRAAADYDLCLRCTAATPAGQIIHIPHVLYHRGNAKHPERDQVASETGRRALTEFLSSRDPRATVEAGRLPGTYRVRRWLPAPPPLASLIIPTRDGVSLLRRCIESIRQKTSYPSYEILVVDNQSRDPATLSYLAEIGRSGQATIIPYDQPFNYSAINNLAVERARGELIGLLNNDVEVIESDWLSEMASQALRPEVGAVGAKLYYPNGEIQHAGVVVGLGGVADHGHRHFSRDAPGYMGRLHVVQNVSAVTAACLVMRRSLYRQLGGLDAEHLAVSFNDVDLCLRLHEAGYLNVWTPYAELLHHESVTRGPEDTPEKKAREAREIDFMKRRWGANLLNDRHYSPNLTIEGEDFSLAWPPRAPRPWKRDL